jgi:hypothetical protein
MNFGGDETTAIANTPNMQPALPGVWHTLDGRRLLKEPTKKGVYILNGKKTIIK